MRLAFAVLPVALVVLTSGCTGSDDDAAAAPTASVTLAPDCSGVRDRLPATVLDREKTSAATGDLGAAGADGGAELGRFGDPAIIVSCGVPDRGPTTDQCITINDIDWVFVDSDSAATQTDDPDAPDLRFTTYGRTPVVQVQVPASLGGPDASAALVDLTDAVKPLPVSGKCLGADDL